MAVLVLAVFFTQLSHQREAIQSTQITFGGIQQKSLEQDTATLGLDLNMLNSASTNVSLDHTVYELYANGTHIVNGTIPGSEEIAPGQTIKVSTDGVIPYFGTLKSLLTSQRNGSITWEMKGTSYFAMPIVGLIPVPFDVSIPSSYSTHPNLAINQVNAAQTNLVGKNKTSSIPVMLTHISLQPAIMRVSQGKTAGLTGQLTDATGKGIANQTVYVKSETPHWLVPTLGLASTDSSGWFTISWTANQTSWDSSIADVYAVFEGSHVYSSSKSNPIHLEVLVSSSLKTGPPSILHQQNNTFDIVHETSPVYQVGVGTFSDIAFNVPCQVTATGSFSTSAESDRNIIVTIFDQKNHDKFERNLPYFVNYYSGKAESGNFTLSLQPGVYYLMLSNTYSVYPKTVTIHASYYCNT